jgi:hypothetical protein
MIFDMGAKTIRKKIVFNKTNGAGKTRYPHTKQES